MKKLFILILLIALNFLMAEKLHVSQVCNLRDVMPFSQSKILTTILEFFETEILDSYGPYIKVKIISGSDHAGKIGWMWTERIDFENLIISPEGCCLRSEPKKADDTLIAKVRNGAKLEILEMKPTFYKINYKGEIGWVWYRCIDIIK